MVRNSGLVSSLRAGEDVSLVSPTFIRRVAKYRLKNVSRIALRHEK